MHRPGWILGLSLTLFASVGCGDDPMSPTAPDPYPGDTGTSRWSDVAVSPCLG